MYLYIIMIVYLIKLILILVFNTCVNIYYINSGCNCCCGESNKNNSDGGIQGDKIEIDLVENTLKCNGKILTGFEKIDNPVTNNVKRVINGKFENGQNIYYTINEVIFNSIKEDSNVEIIKTSDSDEYIVFAVKTQVENFDEKDQKYDYYLVYCHNGDSVSGCGLFEKINTNDEIKILCSGNNLKNIGYMFFGGKKLKKIIFTIKGLNTSNVTNMNGMFKDCKKLKELNLSTFNTSKVTNMAGMFYGCSSLKKINLSNFNTNNVTNMEDMFYECSSLEKLNLSNFSTKNVTNMSCMFFCCEKLNKLDLSKFNTSKVTNMEGMFYECKSLTSLNVSNFNTENVTNMESMFEECRNLKELDLSNFSTNKVTNMECMFKKCESLKKLNISNFDTSNVTNMNEMFLNCTNLANLNISKNKFNTNKVTKDIIRIFLGCNSLKDIETDDNKLKSTFSNIFKQ